MFETTLRQARSCGFSRKALRGLMEHLPASEEELDRLLGESVAAKDADGFTRLLLASLEARRSVSARHLTDGAALLPDPSILAAVAARLKGDVAGALVAAVEGGAMGWEREGRRSSSPGSGGKRTASGPCRLHSFPGRASWRGRRSRTSMLSSSS